MLVLLVLTFARGHSFYVQRVIAAEDTLSATVSGMLPLFHEHAHSVAMIRHAMNIVKSSASTPNPCQIPVIAFDQPLFTIAKLIQWNWPETHGENHFVMMFGGLHVEIAALKALGSLLSGSGWAEVTAVLLFVRSLREANCALCVDSLTNLMPWFFVLDRTNYARWLSVHIRDMLNLSSSHPSVFVHFSNGKFTVNKIAIRFAYSFEIIAITRCALLTENAPQTVWRPGRMGIVFASLKINSWVRPWL